MFFFTSSCLLCRTPPKSANGVSVLNINLKIDFLRSPNKHFVLLQLLYSRQYCESKDHVVYLWSPDNKSLVTAFRPDMFCSQWRERHPADSDSYSLQTASSPDKCLTEVDKSPYGDTYLSPLNHTGSLGG